MTMGLPYTVIGWRRSEDGIVRCRLDSVLAIQWDVTGPDTIGSGMTGFESLHTAQTIADMCNRAFECGKEQKLIELRNFLGVKKWGRP